MPFQIESLIVTDFASRDLVDELVGENADGHGRPRRITGYLATATGDEDGPPFWTSRSFDMDLAKAVPGGGFATK